MGEGRYKTQWRGRKADAEGCQMAFKGSTVLYEREEAGRDPMAGDLRGIYYMLSASFVEESGDLAERELLLTVLSAEK